LCFGLLYRTVTIFAQWLPSPFPSQPFFSLPPWNETFFIIRGKVRATENTCRWVPVYWETKR
jgi:hypothetical protein